MAAKGTNTQQQPLFFSQTTPKLVLLSFIPEDVDLRSETKGILSHTTGDQRLAGEHMLSSFKWNCKSQPVRGSGAAWDGWGSFCRYALSDGCFFSLQGALVCLG